MFKRTCAFAVAILSSTGVFANNFFPNAEEDRPVWSLTGQGNYIEQSSNLAGWVETRDYYTDLSTVKSFNESGSNWGWAVELGYLFPNHVNDIQLTYSGTRNSAANEVNDYDSSVLLPNPLAPGYDVSEASSASVAADFNYDVVDVTFGNYFDITECFSVRVGYGLSYVNINQSADATYYDVYAGYDEEYDDYTSHQKSQFEGFGPKLTLDTQWTMGQGFYLVNGLGFSAIYGNANAQYNGVVPLGDDQVASAGEYDENYDFSYSEKRMAFGFDSKLGVRFQHMIVPGYDFAIEGGYRGTTYLNAMYEGSAGVSAYNRGNAYEFGDNDYFNFGPYLAVNVNYL